MSEKEDQIKKQQEIERQKKIDKLNNSDKQKEINREKAKSFGLLIERKKENKDTEGRVSTGDDD